MTNSEKLASIKFGSTRFSINLTGSVDKFLKENGVDTQKLVPTSPSWYSTILENLGTSHEDEKEIEILFYSVKGKYEENAPEDYKASFESPLRFKGQGVDKEEIVKFVCKVVE